MMEPALAAVETVAAGARESAMIGACQLRDGRAGCGMHIAAQGSDRVQPSPASSAIPSRASSPSPVGQKNGVWGVRAGPAWLVRLQATPRSRSRLWRSAGLTPAPGPGGGPPALWQGETRTARLLGRQSLLYQAVRLLRGAALSGLADPGRGQGAAPGLAHREGARAAVHARATAPRRDARPSGPRDRRGFDPQGAYLPHRRQRSPAAAADLVRWDRSLRGEPGSVLRVAWPSENRAGAARRHGHVEALSALDRAPRPAGQHPVRQVPRPPAPRVRAPRRGIPSAQDPHLHAAGDLTVPSHPQVLEITHTISRRPEKMFE